MVYSGSEVAIGALVGSGIGLLLGALMMDILFRRKIRQAERALLDLRLVYYQEFPPVSIHHQDCMCSNCCAVALGKKRAG